MIKLSNHTTREMDGRGIKLGSIESALAYPDGVTADATDPALSGLFKSVAEFGGRILRVVHRSDGDDVFVVTAHWDRGAKV